MKVGIIREEKIPVDHRVPFTPNQVKELITQYPDHNFVVQKSEVRAFKDKEYADLDIEVVDSLEDCEVIFGVKEVPISTLLDGKTYFFFSHTTKMQPYNKGLLQSVLKKNNTLIDYEGLALNGQRVVAFGRWAGIVGAYNGLRTFGLKNNKFDLKPANQCFDLDEMYTELDKLNLGSIKIVLTGGGRVSKGAMEVLDKAGIRKVAVSQYLNDSFEEPVYAQLDMEDYHVKLDGSAFETKEFYNQPELYTSAFEPFTKVSDVLIAGAFWDPKAPVLFTEDDLKNNEFNISVIADITCDIKGSIPTTVRPSTVADPIYDICKQDCTECKAFESRDAVSVMAVDNLPCELPRDASHDFGSQLLNNVVPHFFGKDSEGIISGAMITKKGSLTDKYSYLESWIN